MHDQYQDHFEKMFEFNCRGNKEKEEQSADEQQAAAAESSEEAGSGEELETCSVNCARTRSKSTTIW